MQLIIFTELTGVSILALLVLCKLPRQAVFAVNTVPITEARAQPYQLAIAGRTGLETGSFEQIILLLPYVISHFSF